MAEIVEISSENVDDVVKLVVNRYKDQIIKTDESDERKRVSLRMLDAYAIVLKTLLEEALSRSVSVEDFKECVIELYANVFRDLFTQSLTPDQRSDVLRTYNSMMAFVEEIREAFDLSLQNSVIPREAISDYVKKVLTEGGDTIQ